MTTNNENTPQPIGQDEEIDLLALAKTIWKGRRILLLTTAAFALIGLLIAILSPKEYSASTVVIPQIGKSGSKMGGLSSLAAMAGFNLDMASASDVLPPIVYPQIIKSIPFQLDLMNIPLTFSEVDRQVSLYEYCTNIDRPSTLSLVKKYTIGLPGVIINALRPAAKANAQIKGPIRLTPEQESVSKMLAQSVTLTINPKEGYLTITANMPEAQLAAEVVYHARELLQKYITQLKIEKATDQLNFINARYNEKKKEFEKVQKNLAYFRDQNRNIATSMARTEEERLESEYTIAFNVYSELARQLEQAQIQVKEDTPVLSVLAPESVPAKKDKPKRAMILAISIFLGLAAGVAFVFVKEYWATLKEKWEAAE